MRSRLRLTVLAAVGAAAVWIPSRSVAAAPADILPYAQVREGMKGTGRTVLHGEEIEEFDAEIIGKIDRIGPGQSLILARLSSPTIEKTGILEGMSGSPVLVDGKMIGAVAYSWGFAREPIAGITPIEEMLEIPETAPKSSLRSGASGAAFPSSEIRSRLDLHEPLLAANRFDAFLASLVRRAGASSLPQLALPVSAPGLSPAWVGARLGGSTIAGSLALRYPGGGTYQATKTTSVSERPETEQRREATSAAAAPRPLAPGDAVGAQLIEGDVEFTAFGTVTRVDGDRVLAFGHPFLQVGNVEYAMRRARVESLLPSLQSSFKFASPGELVGAFHQDRAPGLAGKLGARARMVPVRLELRSDGSPPRTFAYQVVADPLLTPVLLYLSIGGILETTQKGVGDSSVELAEGSVLLLDEDRKADLSNFFAGRSAVLEASAMVGLIAEALLQNDHEPVRAQGVNLIVKFSDDLLRARITGAWTDRRQVHPGEQIVLTVGLQPHRKPEILETIPIEVPKELEPGRMTIHVGEALAVTRVEQSGVNALLPIDLDQLLDLINSLRKNRSLSILGTREEPSLLIGSEPLPNLPPSKSALILHGDSRGSVPVLRSRAVLDESVDADYEIEGYRRVEIEVIR